MIVLLATLALLQQGAQLPAELLVRAGDRETRIPVVATRLGPMVRALSVLAPLGAALRQDDPDRWRLTLGPTEIILTRGLRVARVGDRAEPLGGPPTVSEGVLFIPVSLLTDVIPRVATGFVYDAAAGELRRFTPVVARRPPADSPSTPRAPASAAEARANEAVAGRPSSPRPSRAPKRQVVVLDAGHGGRDRGMRGPIGVARKVHEADVTLAVAERLREEFTSRGVDVVMTRSSDTLIALDDRGRIANRAKGDVFLSVHVNAANPRWRDPAAARGFETYFLAEAKTEDDRRVADLENEAVKYEVEEEATSDDPLSFILNDMKQNEYLRESSDLAAMVQRGLGRVHPAPSRGVKQAGFRVLVGAFMPAVLVELGFGSNPGDSAYMTSARGQRDLATAIADATMAYLARYGERRAVGSGGTTR